MASRMQALTVTDSAADRIRALLSKRGKPSLGIRVGVRSRGCSGLTYTLEYKNSLQDSTWMEILPSLPGTGNLLSLQDTNGSLLPSRFYRVRSD